MNTEDEYYRGKARYYDITTKKYYAKVLPKHLDFLNWAFDKYLNGKPTLLLEAACGTGAHGISLAKAGIEVTGVDISSSMLEVYKKKVEKENLDKKITLMQADLTNFRSKIKFDVAISLFNEIYDIGSEKNVSSALKSIYDSLRAGGVYVFMLEDFSQRKALFDRWGDGRKTDTWISFNEDEGVNIQETIKEILDGSNFSWETFLIVDDNGKMSTVHEKHSYHLWGYDKMLELISGAGFDTIDCYSDMSKKKKYSEGDSYMTFVAQKSARSLAK